MLNDKIEKETIKKKQKNPNQYGLTWKTRDLSDETRTT
jgi:hypothetical protein